MTDRTPYIDHSPSALINEQSIAMAQQHLIDLGYNLGPSGADGDWGERSRLAAIDWQNANNYRDSLGHITGDITTRQMDVLAVQAADPSIFHRQKLQEFYTHFKPEVLASLDPARAAIVMQAAAHIGVREDGVLPDGEGTNNGIDVENYLGAYHMEGGNAWCASFGSWAFDQIEKFAGIEQSSFMRGSPSVHSTLANIQADAPQSIKSLNDYTPQPGDILITRHAGGTGHLSIVAVQTDESLITIDGNSGDSVLPNSNYIYTDPETGRSFPYIFDESNIDPETGEIVSWPEYYDPENEIFIIDISELPNYNNLNNQFNHASEFVPTPTQDSGFQPDVEALTLLQETMAEGLKRNESKLPIFEFVQADAPVRQASGFNTTIGPS